MFKSLLYVDVTFTVSCLFPQVEESVAEEKVHSEERLFDHLARDGT